MDVLEEIAQAEARVREIVRERDPGRTKADWEQKKGVFHDEGYVDKENLLQEMDAPGFTKILEYHARLIEELEKAAAASVLLRSGFAIIIRPVRAMSEDPSRRPFCM